ncbi:MAG TPA: FecR family protein [Verrucomicrobiales bacterium]|nr:FecR family protein [Verrucomicrobiales bacterium]
MEYTGERKLRRFGRLGLVLWLVCSTFAAAEDVKISLVVGRVEASFPGSTRFTAVKRGDAYPEGTTIRTGAGSRAVIVSGPGVVTRLGPETSVVVGRIDTPAPGETGGRNDIRFDLESGNLSALIDRSRDVRTEFEITTPHGTAAARGTIYGVSASDGRSFVKVREGKVDVRRGRAGEVSSSEKDEVGTREKSRIRRPSSGVRRK